MARAGADVVLCQHTHCIGCYEEYEGSHILYGQGNFHFLGLPDLECWFTGLAVEYDTASHEINFVPIRALEDGITLAKGEDKENIMADFEKRGEELKSGEWKNRWEEFAKSVMGAYCDQIAKLGTPGLSENDRLALGHYIDCESHQDVLRVAFKSWNFTNCIDED